MYGQGNVSYHKPASAGGGGGGTVTGANDGTSLFGTIVRLGQAVNAVGDPAALTEDREIPGAFRTHIKRGGLDFNDPLDPMITANLTTGQTHYIERLFTSSANNLMPHERLVDANPNGGPPDDLIHIEGWNIDSRYSSVKPSWTTRMEWQYTGSLYEYHIQWASAGGSRVLRLMSFTFQDHGGTGDDCLLYVKTAGFEIRPLVNDQCFFSVGNNVGLGTDLTNVERANNARSIIIRDSVDTISGPLTYLQSAPGQGYRWSGFASYGLQVDAAGGSYQFSIGGQPAPWPTPGIYIRSSADYLTITDPIFTSAADHSYVRFSPGSAGGLVRAYLDIDQNIGRMLFWVQAGGYYYEFAMAGVGNVLTIDGNGLTTADPGTGPAGWKLGAVHAAAVTTNLARYIEVNIAGVVYKLLTAN